MSTRFYYGQKDYIVQLNTMDDIATSSATSAQYYAGIAQQAAIDAGAFPVRAMHVQEIVVPGNVRAGSLLANPAECTFVLNTLVDNDILNASLTGNGTIILPSGRFRLRALTLVTDASTNQTRLVSLSGDAVDAYGLAGSLSAPSNKGVISELWADLILTQPTEIQLRTARTAAWIANFISPAGQSYVNHNVGAQVEIVQVG